MARVGTLECSGTKTIVGLHYVSIGIVWRTQNGKIYTSRSGMTIADSLHANTFWAVYPDTTNENTQGYPTIQEYLNREAADDYKPNQVTQTFIITIKEV